MALRGSNRQGLGRVYLCLIQYSCPLQSPDPLVSHAEGSGRKYWILCRQQRAMKSCAPPKRARRAHRKCRSNSQLLHGCTSGFPRNVSRGCAWLLLSTDWSHVIPQCPQFVLVRALTSKLRLPSAKRTGCSEHTESWARKSTRSQAKRDDCGSMSRSSDVGNSEVTVAVR